MNSIQCFLLKDTNTVRRSLRRYTYSPLVACPERAFGHNAESSTIDVVPQDRSVDDRPSDDDPRWPARCSCGYEFTDLDPRQLFTPTLWQREGSGDLVTLHEAPAGAMYFAPWYDETIKAQLEHNLMVVTPAGVWHIDSQATNCTIKDDWRQERHHCWVLHGEPPFVTVDKNGTTCQAGAGSIAMPGYHGFLRNGRLENA